MAKAGILVAMLALAACRTAHVSGDYDHSAQFSGALPKPFLGAVHVLMAAIVRLIQPKPSLDESRGR